MSIGSVRANSDRRRHSSAPTQAGIVSQATGSGDPSQPGQLMAESAGAGAGQGSGGVRPYLPGRGGVQATGEHDDVLLVDQGQLLSLAHQPGRVDGAGLAHPQLVQGDHPIEGEQTVQRGQDQDPVRGGEDRGRAPARLVIAAGVKLAGRCRSRELARAARRRSPMVAAVRGARWSTPVLQSGPGEGQVRAALVGFEQGNR
jgi:hypothetical protein